MHPTQQDIRTLHGIVMALVEGRKGPARGGLLDGPEAEMLRNLLAQHGKAEVVRTDSPVRGLARLLRRNPTDAERALWTAITGDRRFAALGFKRQTPIGPHVADFVSFPLRLVVDVRPDSEDAKAVEARRQKLAWMRERDYRIMEVGALEIGADIAGVCEAILAAAAEA
jgi:tRNA/rRNA methyltransferase